MRAVAFTVIFFVYIFNVSLWAVDTQFFAGTPNLPSGLTGDELDTRTLVLNGSENIRSLADDTLNPVRDDNILDRVGEFLTTGYISIWTLLDLLAGTYAFDALETIGVPSVFVLVLKLIFPILVAFNVIYFLIGRY